jgi:hypothetical protein
MPIIGVIASSAKGAPAAPVSVSATDVGTSRAYNNGAATVSFTPGAGATATSFTATSSPGGFTATGASSPLTVQGLQSGVSYTFTVTATNAAGTSPASAASNSITATTVPQAPTIGTATAGATGSGQATVTFTAGATGGKTVSTYTATSSPGSITGTNSASPITVSGLTNGTAYTFTVTATNANGTSTASAASNSITVPALLFAISGGNSSTDLLATTTDGLTWTTRTNPMTGGVSYQMTWGNNLFVATNNSYSKYIISSDGITWTSRGAAASTFQTFLYPILKYQNPYYTSISNLPGGVSYSTNPTSGSWTTIQPFTFQQTNGQTMQAHGVGNNTWLIIHTNYQYYTTNPTSTSWTSRQTGISANWRQISYANGVWVGAMDAGVCVSSNLDNTWSFKNFGQDYRSTMYLGGNNWMAGSSGQAQIRVSSDNGSTWTSRAVPTSFYTMFYNASFPRPYLASGNNYNFYYSSDGVTWTAVATGSGNDYFGGAFNA